MVNSYPFIGKFSRLLIIFTLMGSLIIFSTYSTLSPAEANGDIESVIVQGEDIDQVISLVEQYGGEVTSRLEIINGISAKIPSLALSTLEESPGILRITRNAIVHLSSINYERKEKLLPTTDYPDVIGADLVWQQDVTGNGVTVALIDTGVANHPELKIDTNDKKRNPIVAWVDFVEGKDNPTDPNGHGTHIAGIIVNATKGLDGEFNGVAPDVKIAAVRVLDRTGTGDYEKVIKGIQWVIENKDQYNIRVLNLSLYSLVQSPYWADPLNQAVMRAWAEGITVIVAAGNEGPNPMSISVPGNVPYVVTVGAFTDNYTPENWSDDYLAQFSSAGPTLDSFTKPDLLAPGAHITSTMMPGSYLAKNHEANWVTSHYFTMAGTSQAAAIVSGVTALAYTEHPELSPDQMKYRLMITSLPWINNEQTDILYSVWQQGAGRVNAYDATFAENIDGVANLGMDITADLEGTQHYEGYSYFDETTGTFKLHGFEALTGGYGSWAGGYGSWAGGYGSWAGGYGSWAGGYGSWAGGYGSWAGGYGSWAGGYGSWAGGYGSWAGGYGVWAGQYNDPIFLGNFINGISPDLLTTTGILNWVDEPE